MSTNTITEINAGDTILASFWNQYRQALYTDLVGRDTSGVPTSGQNLGTAAFPWGTLRANALIVGGSSVDVSQVSAPPFRVVSGATRSTSNQPAFLDPAGSGNGASVDIKGATTSLVVEINGVSVTVSSDLTKSSLSAAPSTNNTALVNDTDAADQESTRTWGEVDGEKSITIDTAGSEITSLVGTWQAFKINDGTNDEYFFGYIESTTEITKCYRGYFYDDTLAPINRIKFANNDTITLMKAHHIFLDSDGSTIDTQSNYAPVYQDAAPGSPATGDYWYDTVNNLWKRYDGASFQTVNRVYLGIAVMDDTDCVAARCVHFDARYKPSEDSVFTELSTSEIILGKASGQSVNVAGNEITFGTDVPEWNITVDLAASADMYNATEQASTDYFLYVADDGTTVMSDISPHFRSDLYGRYHPHNPWKCIGVGYNDGSSDLVSGVTFQYDHTERNELHVHTGNGHGGSSSGDTAIRNMTTAIQVGPKYVTRTARTTTAGDVHRISVDGEYAIEYTDTYSANAARIGLSNNTSETSTTINSLTNFDPDRLALTDTPGAGLRGQVTWSGFLRRGDLVRMHTNTNPDSSSDSGGFFKIRRMS